MFRNDLRHQHHLDSVVRGRVGDGRLLNLVPRYLPRYGMAPEWTKATRPLVVFFTAITFLITVLFKADVDAQGGAYATGVLVLITSAAFAVTLWLWRQKGLFLAFTAITLVFLLHHDPERIERPDGVKIASGSSWRLSRRRSSRERALDRAAVRQRAAGCEAARFIREAAAGTGVASSPTGRTPATPTIRTQAEGGAGIAPPHRRRSRLFVEVHPGDVSEFGGDPGGRGHRCRPDTVCFAVSAPRSRMRSPHCCCSGDATGQMPHAYFGWTEGNPVAYLLKFLAFGEGDTAPVTREVLRQAEPDPARRPRIHVG